MLSILTFTQLALTTFWAIVFVQSGLDKVLDRKGNLSWLKGHFKDSPLAGMVPLLLSILTIVELTAGILCVIGVAQILISDDLTFAQYGIQLSTVALLMLFFGQRLSKDYAGAAVIATYFAVALLSLYLIG
ncbi:DoxX family protein [Lewinella sp. LCG006]|uniref:DoxX family protein n=1 Tax=Lewinella sp. LCG006 TaxID=3231911 RepID=UPI00345F871F